MSSDSIDTRHSERSSFGSELVLDSTADRLREEITDALCMQLDCVLDELWSFASDQSANAANSVTLAKLVIRLCRLYPRPTPSMRQRIALGERVLELQGSDAAHGREALLGRLRVSMTHREAALLRYLVANRERIISRDELLTEVWQKRLTGQVARTVDIHVHRLRKKLGHEFAERLETVRNVGYRFSLCASAPELEAIAAE